MCNVGQLEADPVCMVMTGEPFIYHAGRLDDDGRRATEISSGRFPVTVAMDAKQGSNRIGGENGWVLSPLDGTSTEEGPTPPAGTEVVYGVIDVPFFFQNFESGDFRFWSGVQGQAGG